MRPLMQPALTEPSLSLTYGPRNAQGSPPCRRLARRRRVPARGRFAYSNTNSVVLGMVVQQVTGHSYAVEAERRIITPLHLRGTSFPGARTALPPPHKRAY